MKLIKTAIIGMGKMGKIRYEALRRHCGFEISALCDVDESSMADFEESKYQDWLACLQSSKPDAVFVCTFNCYIADIVCKALDMGIHVFAEKPPGRNLGDTLRIQRVYKNSGKVLKFGFNHRYHNSIIETKTLLDNKLLGDLVCARGVYGKSNNVFKDWRNDLNMAGGGILLDQGIHILDLLCYFFGGFTHVNSLVNKLIWQEYDAEDSVFAILKTEDGRVASLHSSAIQWKHKFDLDLICTNGYISLNGLLTPTKSYGEERITYYRKNYSYEKFGNPAEHTMFFNEDNSWDYEVAEFYEAVSNGNNIINGTIEDAVRVMELIEKTYVNGSSE